MYPLLPAAGSTSRCGVNWQSQLSQRRNYHSGTDVPPAYSSREHAWSGACGRTACPSSSTDRSCKGQHACFGPAGALSWTVKWAFDSMQDACCIIGRWRTL